MTLVLALLVISSARSHSHSQYQLRLGASSAEVRSHYGKRLQTDERGGFIIDGSYWQNGFPFDADVQFDRRHRVSRIELFTSGEETCGRVENRLKRQLGRSIDQDLLADHSMTLWYDGKQRSYVQYRDLWNAFPEHGKSPWYNCWVFRSYERPD